MNLLPSGLARLIVSVAIAESEEGSPTHLMIFGSQSICFRPIFENFKNKQMVHYKSEPNVNHTQVIEQRFITN